MNTPIMLVHKQQVKREVALDLLVDVPRGQARQHAHEPGQDHQAQADPVQTQVVLDVEIGNPRAADDQVGLGRPTRRSSVSSPSPSDTSLLCATRSRSDLSWRPALRIDASTTSVMTKVSEVKPSATHLTACSARLGKIRTVTRPIKGTSQRDVSSRLSLIGRSPVQGEFREVSRVQICGSTHAASHDRVLAADPGEHADEQTDQPDRQKHQVVAQAAGLDRPAPVAADINGLGRQVDETVDGDHVEHPVVPAQ